MSCRRREREKEITASKMKLHISSMIKEKVFQFHDNVMNEHREKISFQDRETGNGMMVNSLWE